MVIGVKNACLQMCVKNMIVKNVLKNIRVKK